MVRILRTMIRVCIYGFLALVTLVSLWMTLPSPSVDNVDGTYATDVLRAGRTLTRIYE